MTTRTVNRNRKIRRRACYIFAAICIFLGIFTGGDLFWHLTCFAAAALALYVGVVRRGRAIGEPDRNKEIR